MGVFTLFEHEGEFAVESDSNPDSSEVKGDFSAFHLLHFDDNKKAINLIISNSIVIPLRTVIDFDIFLLNHSRNF